jgi:tetratricopeptide (TPR) repeat protein
VYFERGLAALSHLPGTRLPDAVDIRVDLRSALWAAGDSVASEHVLREAEQLASLLGDPRRIAQISGALAHSLRMTGRTQEAGEFAARGLAIADSLQDVSVQAAAYLYGGVVEFFVGELDRAQGHFERVIDLLVGDRVRERGGMVGHPAVTARGFLAHLLAERGFFAEGLHHAHEGTRIAETLGQPYNLGNAWFAHACHQATQGEWGESRRLMEAGLALCRTWSLSAMIPMMSYPLGLAYAFTGQPSDGVRLLEEAVAGFAARGFDWGARVLIPLGQAYLLADRPSDGLVTAHRALALARERGERLHAAYAQRLLGEASAQGADCAAAEPAYREALALAVELEMRPLTAHCHLGLGNLYRRTGDHAKAEEHLTTATTMYREMGMTYWLEKAEAALGAPHAKSP